MVLFVIVLI